MPNYRHVLSAAEIARADRFVFDSDRLNFVAARWALRTLLSRYLGVAPEDVPIDEAGSGKPYTSKLLKGKKLKFNLSHSGGVSIAAFALDKELGVDIECIRSDVAFDDLAERYFAKPEKEALWRLDPAARELAFWATWTRKEAYVKALGEGLQVPLDSFSVSVEPAEEAPALISQDQKRWGLRAFIACRGYICACAVENPVQRLDFWDFTAET